MLSMICQTMIKIKMIAMMMTILKIVKKMKNWHFFDVRVARIGLFFHLLAPKGYGHGPGALHDVCRRPPPPLSDFTLCRPSQGATAMMPFDTAVMVSPMVIGSTAFMSMLPP